jgi:hypothetical protein
MIGCVMTKLDEKFAAFLNKIEALDVQVTVGGDGVYTACSSSEPFFCFDGFSQKEVSDRVLEAIESYGRVYHGLENFKLSSHREDVPNPAVKLEAHSPVAKLGLVVQEAA